MLEEKVIPMELYTVIIFFLLLASFDFLDLAAQTILCPRNDKNAVPI